MTDRELTSQFQSLTDQLLQQYVLVEAVVREIESKSAAPDLSELTRINALMDPVKQTEARIAPLRQQMQQRGLSAPAESTPAIDRTISIVSYLLPKIGEFENSARDARSKLAPSIGQSVRAMKMQSAYGKSR